jgi:hypothetical protein
MKNLISFRIILLIVLSFPIEFANAQGNAEKIKDSKWHLLFTSDEVTVNYKFSDCNLPEWGTNEENAYLQFKNLTNKKIRFSWSPTLWYGDKCYNCEGTDPEMTYTISLEPGQVLEGTCSTETPRYMKIFSRYINPAPGGTKRELKDFQIKNTPAIETIQ